MRLDPGSVAVVTGAGSGIGRALAVRLAARGVALALLDVTEPGLAQTVDAVRAVAGPRAPIWTDTVDVSDRPAVEAAARAVVDRFGHVDLVVNNAGIALDAVEADQVRAEDFRRVVEVNLWGVVNGTQVFLPHLAARPQAAVVNVSSVWGLVGVALQGPYCTSKFAVRGYTEALRMELRAFAPHVRAVVVHPGGIRTAIARNSLPAGARDPAERDAELTAFERGLRTSPEEAARQILDAVLRGRDRVVIGTDARIADVLARALPVRYTDVVLRQMRGVGLWRARRTPQAPAAS